MNQVAPRQDIFDESNCWKRLIEGDRTSLELIYKQYISDLYRFGCSLLNDSDQVKDFIQEVFIDLWKYHLNLTYTDNVKLYLFRCLSNKINKGSHEEIKRKLVTQEHVSQMEYVFESAESQMVQLNRDEATRLKISNAMMTLPMRQKQVINYLFFEQLTYEQTSNLMSINLKSVYTLAWKAISSLKKSI